MFVTGPEKVPLPFNVPPVSINAPADSDVPAGIVVVPPLWSSIPPKVVLAVVMNPAAANVGA